MKAATKPRSRDEEKLLVLHPRSQSMPVGAFEDLFKKAFTKGDVLVLNEASTLPASLRASGDRGEDLEVRLIQNRGEGQWMAVVYLWQSWRIKTEDRTIPALNNSDRLQFRYKDEVVTAKIVDVDLRSPRIVTLQFEAGQSEVTRLIYSIGRPIQYSHLQNDLHLYDVQNAFASVPYAIEMPSASHAISAKLISDLRNKGVQVVTLLHAAGVSSTGDDFFDASLPLSERYFIPQETVDVITAVKGNGRKVIAAGTSVVRALEGNFKSNGKLFAGAGTTDLKISSETKLEIADALLTGLHETAASHYKLLSAFADKSQLERAYSLAEENQFLGHEFGDSMLLFA